MALTIQIVAKHKPAGAPSECWIVAFAIVRTRWRWRLLPWRTSSQKPYRSNSAASDGDLARFDLRIIRAMQSSARPRQDG